MISIDMSTGLGESVSTDLGPVASFVTVHFQVISIGRRRHFKDSP